MLGSELQTAKRASKQYANVYRKDAVTDYDNPTTLTVSTLPENSVTEPPGHVTAVQVVMDDGCSNPGAVGREYGPQAHRYRRRVRHESTRDSDGYSQTFRLQPVCQGGSQLDETTAPRTLLQRFGPKLT
jgi:hypothetical protein